MASELRVNKLTNRSGLCTVTYTDTGAIVSSGLTATGTLTATGDFSISDKIIHTGDTNTALRFPAADTITAETAGSERLRIASNGKVGIGTINPQANLDFGSGSSNEATIRTAEAALILDVNSARAFRVNTNGSERLRIKSDGNVGIGTNNPASLLHLENAAPVLTVKATNASSGLRINVKGQSSGQLFRIQDDNTTKFVLEEGGMVGIGTDNPIRHLHIADYTVDAIPLRIENTGSNTGLELVGGAAKYNYYLGKQKSTDNGFEITPSTAAGNTTFSNPAITIKHDGKIGINTITPGTNLTVWANDGVTDADVFQVRSKTGAFNIQVSDSDAANPEWAIRTYSSEPIVFKQATTERMRIKSDGNVGIGTDNPQVKLTVSSTSPAVCDIHHIDGGTNDEARIILGALALNPPSNRGAGIAAVNNGAGHDLIIKCSASHSHGPTEKLRIKSDGKMGLGTDSPTALLHITGAGSPTILNKPSDATPALFIGDSNRTSDGQHLAEYRGLWNGTLVSRMVFSAGNDTTNKDNGNIDFYTASAGTTNLRLRITPGGEVLAGGVTDSVAVSGGALPFQVRGSTGYTGASLIRTTAAGAQLQFAAGSSGNNVENGDGLGYIKFYGYHTNGYDEYARIYGAVDNTCGDGDAPGAIVFATTNDGASSVTERARFTSGDQLLINRTTSIHANAKLEIQGGTTQGESNYIQTWKGNSDDIAVRNMSDGDYEITNSQNGNQLALYDGSGGGRIEYYNNGDWIGMLEGYSASNRVYNATNSGSANVVVTSQGYIRRSTSSRRYKDNIREYVGVGVSAIKQIVPKLWEDHVEGSTKLGFIAEDIHSIGLTNAVEYEPYIGGSEIGIGVTYGDMYGNGTTPVTKTGEALDDEVLVVDGIDNTAIIAELVLAIKQLTARVEELESGG